MRQAEGSRHWAFGKQPLDGTGDQSVGASRSRFPTAQLPALSWEVNTLLKHHAELVW